MLVVCTPGGRFDLDPFGSPSRAVRLVLELGDDPFEAELSGRVEQLEWVWEALREAEWRVRVAEGGSE